VVAPKQVALLELALLVAVVMAALQALPQQAQTARPIQAAVVAVLA
jgi:hypothetical protein